MRDEMDARLWAEHHEQFSEMVDKVVGALGAALRRLGGWDGSTAHLVSMLGALALTALTFRSTAI